MSEKKFGPPWTPEAVAAEARRYKTRREFKLKANSAYNAARLRLNILDEVCAHMPLKRKPKDYWTRERVSEIVKTCSSYDEFRHSHTDAYNAVRRSGWQDLVADLPRPHRWARDEVVELAGQCASYEEFVHNHPNAYNAILKHGWRDLVADLPRSRTQLGYWTFERVKVEAAKYQTRTAFMKGSAGAYDKAHKSTWLDEVCRHMVSGRSVQRHWTRERIKELADTCETSEQFRSEHRLAYRAVSKNGWHDLLASLPRTRTPLGWWTLARVTQEAAKYKTRTAFMKGSGGAYQVAHRRGWLNDVCTHMVSPQKPTGYWTRERVLDEARQYSSRSEFLNNAAGAYQSASRKGFLDEACAHMEKKGSQYERAVYAFEFEDHSVYVGLTFDYDVRYREHRTQDKHIGRKLKKVPHKFVRFNEWFSLEAAGKEEARVIESYRKRGWTILNRAKPGGVGSRPQKWTFDEVKALAAEYDKVKAFREANPSAYTAALKQGWWTEIGQHMTRAVEHGKWTLEALIAEASKYSSRREFGKENSGAYSAAGKQGLLDQVCRHMERLVNPVGYWTKSRVAEEASKYSTKGEFQKLSPAAYQKAWKASWLDDVCGHMVETKKPTGYWTLERIKQEAKKYATRVEFQKGAMSAFNRAYQNGWLDEVCEHMELLRKPAGYWTRELILEEVAKHETLKEFRDSQGGAYDAAYEMGLMPELHRLMKMDKKPNRYWTFERVTREAKKYRSRSAFQQGAMSAYGAAWKNGWLDEVCSHMKKANNKPNSES